MNRQHIDKRKLESNPEEQRGACETKGKNNIPVGITISAGQEAKNRLVTRKHPFHFA